MDGISVRYPNDSLAKNSNGPTPPNYSSNAVFVDPDLKLTMPEYTSQADANDDYICVALSSGLTTDKYIKGVEVLPGNPEIVHHVLVYIDTSSNYSNNQIL